MLHPGYDIPLKLQEAAGRKLAAYVEGEKEWFHRFVFSNGLITPGRDPSAKKLHHLCLPSDLSGLSVLDIGAFEGYFSFHCEQRGAERVVANDKFVWEWPGCSAWKNFDTVRSALGSRVDTLQCDVESLSPATVKETFDIVLFLGVLYHAPNMIEYLRNVYSVTKNVCVLETHVDSLDVPQAVAEFYGEGELNNDSTNWWGPNLRALTTMLRRVGFREVVFVNFWDINTRAIIDGDRWDGAVKSGRVVLHAYR